MARAGHVPVSAKLPSTRLKRALLVAVLACLPLVLALSWLVEHASP